MATLRDILMKARRSEYNMYLDWAIQAHENLLKAAKAPGLDIEMPDGTVASSFSAVDFQAPYSHISNDSIMIGLKDTGWKITASKPMPKEGAYYDMTETYSLEYGEGEATVFMEAVFNANMGKSSCKLIPHTVKKTIEATVYEIECGKDDEETAA